MFEPGSLFLFYSIVLRPQALELLYLLVFILIVYVLSRSGKNGSPFKLELLFVALIVPQALEIVALAVYVAYRFHWKLMSTEGTDIALAISPYFEFSIVQLGELTLLTSVVTYAVIGKVSWREIGFKMPTTKALKTFGSVTAALIVFIAANIIIRKLPIPSGAEPTAEKTGIDQLITQVRSAATTIHMVTIVIVIVVVPVIEELFFRGLIFTSIERVSSPRIALLLQAGLFSAMHEQSAHYLRFFAFGIIAGYLFYKSRSILPSALFHATVNFAVVASGLSH